MKYELLFIFGTHPEAIKMTPLIRAFQKETTFDTKVCVTAQHHEMLDQVLGFFDIKTDYDLNVMRPNQSLYTLTATIITELKAVLEDCNSDYVFVHGDTTTTMAASIAGFYAGAKVYHIGASLRTFNKYAPFPEEINRKVTGAIADFHFAPTRQAKQNLLREGVDEKSILVTGNTVIDALLESSKRVVNLQDKEIDTLEDVVDCTKKLILVTGHGRENRGEGLIHICEALKEIALQNPEVQIIYPVHLNPNVREPIYRILSGIENVKLIAPLAYPAFVWLMNQSYLIITGSGDVQKEAPSLGKPVLVMRDTTERPEAVSAGTVILVGTDEQKVVDECEQLLNNQERYSKMSALHSPYGDGKACERIVEFFKKKK